MRSSDLFSRTTALALVFTFIFLLVVTGPWKSPTTAQPGSTSAEPLPVVGSKEKLLELLRQSQVHYPRGIMMDTMVSGAAPEAAPTQNLQAKEAASGDFSRTNIQVEGVDEGDLVKTDGQYIYQVRGQRVSVIKAYPPGEMKELSCLDFSAMGLIPVELFVDDRFLVVIGNSSFSPPPGPAEKNLLRCPPAPEYGCRQATRAVVYDLSDRTALKKVREVEVEGQYLSSRKIGTALYLATNQHLYYWNNEEEITPPVYRDSARGSGINSTDFASMHYFPGCISPSYLVLAALDLGNPQQQVDIQTYLGNGENLYASTANIYVAMTKSASRGPIVYDSTGPSPNSEQTNIYRFRLQGARTSYSGQGTVPGTILNQFSMDEHNGFFRIATTCGQVWGKGANASTNNVYTLDANMNLAGQLEGIAPGEKIYSTRFMGNRVYMVTFKKVDPFFVIDLKDPRNPAILGKLKIPGYSDYLHPYDENHIIGFGKDTVELSTGSGGTQAYYQGLKIALFDVTDVSNPRLMSNQIIGDRGTDSELLQNHRALLFSREKNLLALPVTVMGIEGIKVRSDQGPGAFPEYGSFAFQGAYIYHIDLKNGLQLRGRITHLSEEDYLKAGDSWYDSSRNIQRILYINNQLYTLSPDRIQAHALSNLNLTGELLLP